MAEFLVKARDPIDLPKDEEKRNRCYRRGDIVVVMPDGHEWGKEERLPKFMVVKIPGLSVETAKKYIISAYEDTGIVDQDNHPIMKMVQRRKYRILLDTIPTAIRTAITKDGIAEVSWENVKSHVYDKIALRTE
jgi:hypothetical protein